MRATILSERTAARVCAFSLLALACAHPALAAASAPNGIDTVAAYAGTWKIHIDRVATKYSKAGTDDTTLRNDCWQSGSYYACNQYVDSNSVVLLVFTYGAQHYVYHSYQIPSDGGDSHVGTLRIDGATWTFPRSTNDGGTTIYNRVVNVFSAPDTIAFRQEYSTDRQHWVQTASGMEHRIAQP